MDDICCPKVEEEYGKHVTIHTAKSLYGKCNGYAHHLDLVYQQNLLRKQKQAECDCSDLMVMQFVRVWYVLWTVLPGEPGIPGDPAHVHIEERHGKNVCIH